MKIAMGPTALLLVACYSSSPNKPVAPANTGGPPDPVGVEPTPVAGGLLANDPPDKTVCQQRSDAFGPFTLTEAQVAARYGANAKTYTDAPTTKERAVEVCGVAAERQWLRGTSCADGSAAQQLGRVGSMGPGGRCGAIIDLYRVKCPEAEYEVFFDMYMCGPGESFM